VVGKLQEDAPLWPGFSGRGDESGCPLNEPASLVLREGHIAVFFLKVGGSGQHIVGQLSRLIEEDIHGDQKL
jgi:hypothetical protein